VSRRRLPAEATRFLQRARLREAVAVVAARDGAAFLTVEDVAAEAGVSRKAFYMFSCGASEALVDAAAAGLDFGVRRIGLAFDAQRDRPLAIRAAIAEALALSDAQPHWALFCVRDSHAEPIASGLDRSRRLQPLVERLQEHGSSDAPAWAAIDAVEGAIRHALTTGAPTHLGDLADELTPLVLDLLGERRRGRGRLQQHQRWLVSRVEEAFDRLPASATELEALLVAADADRDGAALWRAFVRLHELGRTRGLSSDERKLQRTAFDGLKEAGHFGLPVMAIAAGAAPERWTPAEDDLLALRYIRTHPGVSSREIGTAIGVTDLSMVKRVLDRLNGQRLISATWEGSAKQWWPAGAEPTDEAEAATAGASDPGDAPAGLFIQPLGDLEQAAMAILLRRPGITEDELRRALGVSQARTRQIIGRLERGLVHRAPAA
jgi:DNA-binding MarR family transcriptional regulator